MMEAKNPEEIYQRISDIMEWYAEYSSVAFPNELLDKRDELAVLSFNLGEITGDSKIGYNKANFVKVINIARDKQSLIESNLAYNRSEVKALLENESYYKDALEKEAIAYKNDILLKQVTAVLFAMDKRIDYAMKEKYISETMKK